MKDGILWTNLSRPEIAAGLAEQGFPVSLTVVDALLEEQHMGQRKPQKTRTMQQHPDRNQQFEHIAELKRQFLAAGLPVLSMDTKKREIIGDYVRPGTVLSSAPLLGWDHDFPTHREGVVIPHGLYDLGLNEGYMHLGDSHETSHFAADALLDWQRVYSLERYPTAGEVLLLCDGGGSNGSRRLVFKEELQRVAERTGMAIRVAHYPPGCSKYNPIEHRLFSQISRKLNGLFLTSLEMFRDIARQTTTLGGLRVFARTLRGLYEIGKRAKTQGIHELNILFDDILPLWNYTIVPTQMWEVI
jgi:hypothetical protein